MSRSNRPDSAEDSAQAPGLGAPLTDRINVEPPILNGMTATEAKVIGLIALVFWLAVGGVIAALIGLWQVLMVFGLFGPMVTVWTVSKRLASIKRGRPDGYYTQWMRINAPKRGLGRGVFIAHHGSWSIGRPISGPLSGRL